MRKMSLIMVMKSFYEIMNKFKASGLDMTPGMTAHRSPDHFQMLVSCGQFTVVVM